MELYHVPRNTEVFITSAHEGVPPFALPVHEGEVITFHHVDGMYSYCHDSSGNVVHLKAWQEVELV